MFPIISDTGNCRDCYRCLRTCAVKAISFRTGQAKILTDQCVLCGKCVKECPQYTKTVIDQLPKLKTFLEKWTEKIKEYKKTYVEMYPVKLAEIKFIYQDIVYSINPYTVSATYMTNFLRNEYYEVEWDSLFETYQREIRDDLKKELGVKYSKYIGFLD